MYSRLNSHCKICNFFCVFIHSQRAIYHTLLYQFVSVRIRIVPSAVNLASQLLGIQALGIQAVQYMNPQLKYSLI